MSNLKNVVVAPSQSAPTGQSLTGCLYHVIQNPGPQGKNVLQLIPVLNTKDNPLPVVSSPVMTNTPVLNVQQPVRFSLPSGVSNVALPCPVSAQLVQQLGSTNYIITTPKNTTEASKTVRVDSKLSPVLLDKPPLNLPSNSQPGTPSFIIMNPKPASVPLKPIPIFPSGCSLQIPPHAEVKSVPASSLPFSLQQRILPQNTSNDATKKVPSVIYVSPVNAVKSPPATSKPNISTTVTPTTPVTPIFVPAMQPNTTSPSKGPLKWVVQENTESKACVVPVKSTNEMASKILTFMSGAKTEELNLPNSPSSNVTNLKENALVMCNNKIYFLTKNGTELKSPVHVKQESTDITPLHPEQGKDLANKVVEVVLSKNNLSSSNSKQTLAPVASPQLRPDVASPAKPQTCTPPQASKKIPEVIYIDDDDDDHKIQKPKGSSHYQSNETSSSKVYTPSESLGACSSSKQDKEAQVSTVTMPPVARVLDDRTLRAKFGIFKQEKVILRRIRVRHPDDKCESRSAKETVVTTVDVESQEKRKSAFPESSHVLKRWRSEEAEEPLGDYSRPSSSTSAAAGWSDVRHSTSGVRTHNPGVSHSSQNISETYPDPSDSHSFYDSSDITGHFSEAPLPRQRFHMESSLYPDETTKDEKIQRLKEVLREREQALEALRRQKWSQNPY